MQLGIQHSVCVLGCLAGCVRRMRERRPVAGSHGSLELLAQAGDHRRMLVLLPPVEEVEVGLVDDGLQVGRELAFVERRLQFQHRAVRLAVMLSFQ
jgi:hypothetical protein